MDLKGDEARVEQVFNDGAPQGRGRAVRLSSPIYGPLLLTLVCSLIPSTQAAPLSTITSVVSSAIFALDAITNWSVAVVALSLLLASQMLWRDVNAAAQPYFWYILKSVGFGVAMERVLWWAAGYFPVVMLRLFIWSYLLTVAANSANIHVAGWNIFPAMNRVVSDLMTKVMRPFQTLHRWVQDKVRWRYMVVAIATSFVLSRAISRKLKESKEKRELNELLVKLVEVQEGRAQMSSSDATRAALLARRYAVDEDWSDFIVDLTIASAFMGRMGLDPVQKVLRFVQLFLQMTTSHDIAPPYRKMRRKLSDATKLSEEHVDTCLVSFVVAVLFLYLWYKEKISTGAGVGGIVGLIIHLVSAPIETTRSGLGYVSRFVYGGTVAPNVEDKNSEEKYDSCSSGECPMPSDSSDSTVVVETDDGTLVSIRPTNGKWLSWKDDDKLAVFNENPQEIWNDTVKRMKHEATFVENAEKITNFLLWCISEWGPFVIAGFVGGFAVAGLVKVKGWFLNSSVMFYLYKKPPAHVVDFDSGKVLSEYSAYMAVKGNKRQKAKAKFRKVANSRNQESREKRKHDPDRQQRIDRLNRLDRKIRDRRREVFEKYGLNTEGIVGVQLKNGEYIPIGEDMKEWLMETDFNLVTTDGHTFADKESIEIMREIEKEEFEWNCLYGDIDDDEFARQRNDQVAQSLDKVNDAYGKYDKILFEDQGFLYSYLKKSVKKAPKADLPPRKPPVEKREKRKAPPVKIFTEAKTGEPRAKPSLAKLRSIQHFKEWVNGPPTYDDLKSRIIEILAHPQVSEQEFEEWLTDGERELYNSKQQSGNAPVLAEVAEFAEVKSKKKRKRKAKASAPEATTQAVFDSSMAGAHGLIVNAKGVTIGQCLLVQDRIVTFYHGLCLANDFNVKNVVALDGYEGPNFTDPASAAGVKFRFPAAGNATFDVVIDDKWNPSMPPVTLIPGLVDFAVFKQPIELQGLPHYKLYKGVEEPKLGLLIGYDPNTNYTTLRTQAIRWSGVSNTHKDQYIFDFGPGQIKHLPDMGSCGSSVIVENSQLVGIHHFIVQGKGSDKRVSDNRIYVTKITQEMLSGNAKAPSLPTASSQ